MTVWITRTRPGAERTARRLSAMGVATLVDPVLEVRPVSAPVELGDARALAFTSPNGVDAFAARSAERGLPAYAVGAGTAEALTEAGFSDVRTAGGDAEALARLLIRDRPGPILHLSPLQPARDLGALTADAGIEVRALVLYQTVPVRPDAALAAEGLEAVLIHSARAAGVIGRLFPFKRLARRRAFSPWRRWGWSSS